MAESDFLFVNGFDQYTDTDDLFARDPSIQGANNGEIQLVPDSRFGTDDGKMVAMTRTKDVGLAISRLIPMPTSVPDGGRNVLCVGGTLIVPEGANAFDGVQFEQRPIMEMDDVQLRLGTGTGGVQNKLVVTTPQANDESTFELLPGGMYMLSLEIEGSTSATASDGRVRLFVNKREKIDTGYTRRVGNDSDDNIMTNVARARYWSPTPVVAWTWDNLYATRSGTTPPFFYADVQPITTVSRPSGWARVDSAESVGSPDVALLTDGDDESYLWSNEAQDPLVLRTKKSAVFTNRLVDEITLIARMSRGEMGLTDAEVLVTDGATVFGSAREEVVGAGDTFVEQRLTAKLSQLKQTDQLDLQLYNRSVA